jgi:hypothetical protein
MNFVFYYLVRNGGIHKNRKKSPTVIWMAVLLYCVPRLIFQLRLRSSFRLSSGRMDGVFFLELSGFDLTKGRRSWGYYKGAIVPPDFSRNRFKTVYFKRPWIDTYPPPVFLDLPMALPRNKETYRTNMTRIGGKSLSFHCNKAQLGRQPFTHSDAFFRYFWIDITMTFYDPRDTLFYDANRKPGLQKISLKIPTLLSRNQVSYVFFWKMGVI